MNKKEYVLDLTGRKYILPEEACVFCKHCTDVYYDATHGIYALVCEKEKRYAEFGNVPCICKEFEEDNPYYEYMK